ncbi:MarR family EPS-associated transcriptional regulator [Methylophilales bacterium]|nr:MarR family EPS-associated transcriptional regulator [Methylophilales bacterium]
MNSPSKIQHPDIHFKIMNLIHNNPDITQRELAKKTGVSLGSIHYCLKALVKKGWVKAGNFKRNPNKSIYLYLLTREGVSQKSKLALDFLRRKKIEFDALKIEIKKLSEEIDG